MPSGGWNKGTRSNYLSPEKHRFCMLLVETGNIGESYDRSHPHVKGSRQTRASSASRLMARPEIKNCIAELRAQVAEKCKITVERVTKMILEDHELARQLEQPSAAAMCVKLLCQVHGLITDKREIKIVNEFDEMSIDQLRQYVAQKSRELNIIEHRALPAPDEVS